MATQLKSTSEAWLNYLALTTVIFAVCATLSTFKGGGYSTKSVMSQSQASDQWAYFQSKGIKEYLYNMQKEKLELELLSLPKNSPDAVTSAYKEKMEAYQQKAAKYQSERKEIEQKAKQLEAARDEAQIHSKAFGMAVIFLQISILLSSIAGLLKKKLVWHLSLVTGLIGILYFTDGFLVIF
jgi:hypothetical protein